MQGGDVAHTEATVARNNGGQLLKKRKRSEAASYPLSETVRCFYHRDHVVFSNPKQSNSKRNDPGYLAKTKKTE